MFSNWFVNHQESLWIPIQKKFRLINGLQGIIKNCLKIFSEWFTNLQEIPQNNFRLSCESPKVIENHWDSSKSPQNVLQWFANHQQSPQNNFDWFPNHQELHRVTENYIKRKMVLPVQWTRPTDTDAWWHCLCRVFHWF